MSGVGHTSTGKTRGALPCALLAGVALVWLILAGAQIVQLCGGQLVEVAEPAHWRDLPEYARPNDEDGMRLGRFRVLARGHDRDHLEYEIYDPAFCKGRGVSLARWFESGAKATGVRSSIELHLRQDASGTFVVSGVALPAMQAPIEDHRFVVAFRRVVGTNATVVSPGRFWLGVMLIVCLVCALFGWFHAHRQGRAGAETPDAASGVGLRRARWGFGIGIAALLVAGVLQLYTDRDEARGAYME
jgi:hypothetical protein